MNENEVMTVEQQFMANIYSRKNLVIERGSGALVWDKSGREYIDCMSAYGVAIRSEEHTSELQSPL
jgi:acetylornithine/succinyldiaminopimelate/putrescine aminotransferase